MNNIFEIKDKTGRSIHLSKERWSHICNEHPSLCSKIEEIKSTLFKPLIIKQSKYDENVKFYYNFIKEKKRYLLVSVKYLNGSGFVVTSFYTKKLEK